MNARNSHKNILVVQPHLLIVNCLVVWNKKEV